MGQNGVDKIEARWYSRMLILEESFLICRHKVTLYLFNALYLPMYPIWFHMIFGLIFGLIFGCWFREWRVVSGCWSWRNDAASHVTKWHRVFRWPSSPRDTWGWLRRVIEMTSKKNKRAPALLRKFETMLLVDCTSSWFRPIWGQSNFYSMVFYQLDGTMIPLMVIR